MANTTNFGWETPDDTDLVKDGAAAMRTLGNAIDTSFVDLKGGTTGQVLSKASNTDLDYTWVTTDDANAIQNAIVDAKGDLISATAADTPARLAVGNNGETLVADSSATTGLRWQGNFAAGKNKIINGDFGIWQRGTSFTQNNFTADRFFCQGTGSTATITQQTFTPGSAPVAGYESQYFLRTSVTSSAGAGNYLLLSQSIEDVRTFAGQTVTFSFWAKADAAKNVAVEFDQTFGTGGSGNVNGIGVTTVSLTTSWARYSVTASIPSISGKTVGTNSYLRVRWWLDAGSNFNARTNSLGQQNITFDVWGVQLEAGNTATSFQTATGTLAGELAACQRYYFRMTTSSTFSPFANGHNATSTASNFCIQFPVQMRTRPTALEQSGTAADYQLQHQNSATNCSAVPTFVNSSDTTIRIDTTVASGLTAGQGVILRAGNTSAYLGWSAEL